MAKDTVNVFWIRRDLRVDDNQGFYNALSGDFPVLPIFIFDRSILDKLEEKEDARLNFNHTQITKKTTVYNIDFYIEKKIRIKNKDNKG